MDKSAFMSRTISAIAGITMLVGCTATPMPDNSTNSSEVAVTNSRKAKQSSGYASVRGGRVYYQVYGPLNPDTKPLVILHGSFMSGDSMSPFTDAFAKDRTVVTIDARDHGRSGDIAGLVTYPDMGDDIAAVVKALKVKKADLFGYSMGGVSALYAAARHPDVIDKQIILAGTARRDGWYPQVLEGMAKANPAAFAGSPIEKEYQRLSPNPDKFASFVKKVLELEKVDYALPDEQVRAIKGKTMIIIGDADAVRLDYAVRLFKLRGGEDEKAAEQGFITNSPRARLAILPGTSHIGLMPEAQRIADLAQPFLNDDTPPRAIGLFKGMDVAPSPN